MAFGLEARMPFTDYRMVEFAFSGALDGHKISHGWSKWVLREACKGLIPADITWRRDKMGFGTPESDFIQALAKSWTGRGRKFERSAGFVDVAKAESIIQRTANGKLGHASEQSTAFRLMVVESWLEIYGLNLQLTGGPCGNHFISRKN